MYQIVILKKMKELKIEQDLERLDKKMFKISCESSFWGSLSKDFFFRFRGLQDRATQIVQKIQKFEARFKDSKYFCMIVIPKA